MIRGCGSKNNGKLGFVYKERKKTKLHGCHVLCNPCKNLCACFLFRGGRESGNVPLFELSVCSQCPPQEGDAWCFQRGRKGAKRMVGSRMLHRLCRCWLPSGHAPVVSTALPLWLSEESHSKSTPGSGGFEWKVKRQGSDKGRKQ